MLQIDSIRIVCQTVKRVTNEILRVERLIDLTYVFITYE